MTLKSTVQAVLNIILWFHTQSVSRVIIASHNREGHKTQSNYISFRILRMLFSCGKGDVQQRLHIIRRSNKPFLS